MNLKSRGFITGVLGFVIGSFVTSQFVIGKDAHPIDGPLTHVAMVFRDVDKAAKTFGDIFGVEVATPRIIRNVPFPPSHGGATMSVKHTMVVTNNNITLELLQPVEGPSPWQDFLDNNGEGVHHLAFTVNDFNQAVTFLQDKGGQWVQGNDTVNFGYVDMMPQLGFTVEVVGASGVRMPAQ